MVKTLYLLRGLPGSGKSTLAKQLSQALNIPYFEADMYHINDAGVYQWQPENIAASHAWCEAQVLRCLEQGISVIVSNTFSTENELQSYCDMAKTHGYQLQSLILENRHHGQNQHQVPEATIAKMKKRFEIQL